MSSYRASSSSSSSRSTRNRFSDPDDSTSVYSIHQLIQPNESRAATRRTTRTAVTIHESPESLESLESPEIPDEYTPPRSREDVKRTPTLERNRSARRTAPLLRLKVPTSKLQGNRCGRPGVWQYKSGNISVRACGRMKSRMAIDFNRKKKASKQSQSSQSMFTYVFGSE